MNPADRQTEIISIIKERSSVTVKELAGMLQISKETVRRDLSRLAGAGKILKFHGGASLSKMTEEGSFQERMSENSAAKILIASKAARLIKPGETVFIDTGSTTLYFTEKISETPHLTVITNSAPIARIIDLSPSQSKAFLLGGEFNGDNQQTFGSLAVSQIRSFRAHHVVLTVTAIDLRTGIMDFCIEEAQLARAMIEQAESVTILVDSSKFGRIAAFEVCGFDLITNLVCDKEPPAEIKNALENNSVNLIYPT